MSVPGYEPLSRPPREGDPVKVVLSGRVEALSRDSDEGREYAEVLLDLGGDREVRVVVPADEVWNHARPDPTDQA
jgi:hypothetical protein